MSLHTGLVQAELTNASVFVAAQNVSATGPGAYTGEVSAGALKDCGIGWALTGHSERREGGETSAQMAAKTKAAVAAGLQVTFTLFAESARFLFYNKKNWNGVSAHDSASRESDPGTHTQNLALCLAYISPHAAVLLFAR
jgi:hypothetical protein